MDNGLRPSLLSFALLTASMSGVAAQAAPPAPPSLLSVARCIVDTLKPYDDVLSARWNDAGDKTAVDIQLRGLQASISLQLRDPSLNPKLSVNGEPLLTDVTYFDVITEEQVSRVAVAKYFRALRSSCKAVLNAPNFVFEVHGTRPSGNLPSQ